MASNNFDVQAQALLNESDEIQQTVNDIGRVIDQLRQNCTAISNAWDSDTSDRDSYLGTLERNLQRVANLCAAAQKLATQLRIFAENAIRESMN